MSAPKGLWMPPWARVHAPTALYEKIVTTAVSTSGVFGEIVAVVGASGPVTISTPNFTSPAQNPKMCFDFAVVNADGAQPITVSAPDGRTINGQASMTIAASPGASLELWYNSLAGNWVALLGSGGTAGVWPPSYTAKGPSAGQTVTVSPTFVNQASITTGVVLATQKLIISYSAYFQQTAGTQANLTLGIGQDVVGTILDAFKQTLGSSAVDVNPGFNTVSWTLEIPGDNTAHTYGLVVSVDVGGNTTMPIGACRGVIRVVNA